MNLETVDEAIDTYVNERMAKGQQQAKERFLAYVYLKHRGDDLGDFLKKVRGLARYYISFLGVMENPLRGPEIAWLASMISVAIFSCYLMGHEESREIGIFVFSGTLVHAWSLLRLSAKKWLDVGVTIAIYREIIQLAEKELQTAAS